MRTKPVLGMIEISGHPEPDRLVQEFRLPVYNYQTDSIVQISFAFYRHGRVYIPACAGEYNIPEPQKLQFAVLSKITLRDYQAEALREMSAKPYGVCVAPAGSGKTIMGAELLRECRVPSIVIVPSIDIKEQWQNSIKRAGLSKNFYEVSTYQGAINNPGIMAERGAIIVDECHRTPCRSIKTLLSMCPAYYRYGFTATPWRADSLHRAFKWLLGGVVCTIDRDKIGQYLMPVDCLRLNTSSDYYGDYYDIQSEISGDTQRDKLILKLIINEKANARPCLVLCDRLDHVRRLKEKLEEAGHRASTIEGQTPKYYRRQRIERMREGPAMILIATNQLAAEGLDIPRLQSIILAAPIGNPSRIEQVIGRVARPYPGKEKGRVIDIVDGGSMCRSLAGKRLTVYRSLGFNVKG